LTGSGGSAPNHYWPTRWADGVARGKPVPRGGGRGEPNPLFLAHTAAITELFVVLRTSEGPGLREFIREPREPFVDSKGDRTLAPDALAVLVTERDEPSVAFVEMDLGTMPHARLNAKAAMYASYAKSNAWREHYRFLPALLFLTTSQPRAARFLDALGTTSTRLAAAAGPIALTPERMLCEPCMTHLNRESEVTLLDVLNEARAPYDRQRKAAEKRRRAKERKRKRMREDPLVIVRQLLRRDSQDITAYLDELGQAGRTAIELAIATNDDHTHTKETLELLAADLKAILSEPASRREPTPGFGVGKWVNSLVLGYETDQRMRINELVTRYGEGPGLRRARAALDAGKLLDASAFKGLADVASGDLEGIVEQENRRAAYEQWREHAAAARVKKTGLLKQLAHSPEQFYTEIDAQQLWVCSRCEEIVYPKFDTDHPAATDQPTKTQCHYCAWPPRHDPDGEANPGSPTRLPEEDHYLSAADANHPAHARRRGDAGPATVKRRVPARPAAAAGGSTARTSS
jgi:phosphoglycolate phosphatase-like HAD superfamily hydrolase